MGEITMHFTIEGDYEGYVIFECPFCQSEFKIQAGEFQNSDVPVDELYCPYCGLIDDKDNFYSKEVKRHIEELATNYVIDEMNKMFGKMAKQTNKNKFIKMTFKPLKNVHVSELKGKETNEDAFKCNICENHVKVQYCSGASKVFCPYCGVDI